MLNASPSIQVTSAAIPNDSSNQDRGWLANRFLSRLLGANVTQTNASNVSLSKRESGIEGNNSIIYPSSQSTPNIHRQHSIDSNRYRSPPKPSRRREWLLKLTSFVRSSLSQSSFPIDFKSSETTKDSDISRDCGIAYILPSETATDLITVERKQLQNLSPCPSPKVILTSTDFLDFVLSCPGNRVERITVRTVVETTSVLREDRKRIIPEDDLDHSENEYIQRNDDTLSHNEFELIHCPSAPLSLYMPPIILIPGGGIFYFWKAGFTMYLSQHFDLSRCIFVGTSAGALASIVTLVSHNIAQASRLSIKMAMERQAWDKSYFVAGILHNLAGQWLDCIIPKDVDVESLKHRLLIFAYRVSRVRLEGLCHFQSRQDLIECLLASIHIPFYANGRTAVKARGVSYLDGSFGADMIKTFAQDIPREKIILIKCGEADYINKVPRRDCIRKLPPKELLAMFHEGFLYAQKLHQNKGLNPLAQLELHSPGTFSISSNPYLDPNRLEDDALDYD